MNNSDFRKHFKNALKKVNITDYENIKFVVEPIYEKEKWKSQTYDEIMRLQILPKKKTVLFDEAIKLFTLWEGFYPCWISVEMNDSTVFLKTSLRMRKANNKDDGMLYPFTVLSVKQ